MLPRPRPGRVIKAEEIAAISNRAESSVQNTSDGLLTAGGVCLGDLRRATIALVDILDERWEARPLVQGGTVYWLSVKARMMTASDSLGWGTPTSGRLIALWWSWFGNVTPTLKVPVVHRRVYAICPESRVRWEMLTCWQPLFRVRLQGAFNADNYAPARFATRGGNTYDDVTIYVYDPAGMFIGYEGRFGYCTYFHDGTASGGRFELVQLQC